MKRLNVNISGELHKEFRAACLKKDVSMREVIETFIKKYVVHVAKG